MRTEPGSAGARAAYQTDGTKTRLRLIVAAERLVAEHGPEGVSSRQISAAAGQTNNYAVQYHFGSKEGLLKAVFTHRIRRIDVTRTKLLSQATANGSTASVRQLLDVLMLPLADEVLDPDSRYVSFNTRVLMYRFADVPKWFREGGLPLSELGFRVHEMMRAEIDHIPEPIRDRRLHNALSNCLLALANYEQRHSEQENSTVVGDADLPFSAFVIDLLDSAEYAIRAPLSSAAAHALHAHELKGTHEQ
jgi:AcrR family transcriptional regulator